jgi:hypothetical protein
MTLSRHDKDADLYSPWSDTPRAFFHPGVGAWQLDPAGLGANLAAYQMIRTSTAATKVANTMASRYCSASGTAAQRRAYAWALWRACNSGDCETIFQEHYCSSSDTVCHITRDTTVSRLGGMKSRTCQYAVPGAVEFTCWFIDPDKAEGYTGWRSDPDGTSTKSPLAFAFYSFWAGTSPDFEHRHWLKADTGYSRGEVWVLAIRHEIMRVGERNPVVIDLDAQDGTTSLVRP